MLFLSKQQQQQQQQQALAAQPGLRVLQRRYDDFDVGRAGGCDFLLGGNDRIGVQSSYLQHRVGPASWGVEFQLSAV